MSEYTFISKIKNNQPLLADGATGTTLFTRGLPAGVTSEAWVIDQPEKIIQLHKDFIHAGADIILTCTFGATSIRLRGSPLEGKADEINRKAVELAKTAAQGTQTLIAGSMGPVGGLLKPYGPLSVEEVTQAYADQARSLSEAGVDLLVVETQFDLGEIKAAIAGIRSVCDLPVVVSLSYDRGKRTMMGVSPTQAVKQLESLPVDVIGINCGKSLEENLENLVELRQGTTKPIWFKPNAGLPQVDAQGQTFYATTPQMMGAQVPSWLESGAQIIGGCCGTSPEHLEQIAAQIKK